jgi:hypothetical protein
MSLIILLFYKNIRNIINEKYILNKYWINIYDYILFEPKVKCNNDYILFNIKISHQYNQSNFDRLRSKICENMPDHCYFIKGKKHKMCIQMRYEIKIIYI